MKKVYEIKGNNQIEGTIKIQGCKNSALAIIAASLLAKDVVVLKNVPNIKDIQELISILKKINVKTSFIDNTLIVDSSDIKYNSLLIDSIKRFRASYYFIGVFLSMFNQVEIYLPGGCQIGKRPIDQHIKGLNALGVNLCISKNVLKASCLNIQGCEINLDIASVGATINLILASLYADKPTIIKNAAKEPEVCDLIDFLNQMGASIVGKGSSVIVINPVSELKPISYTVMPDRIVAGTYLIYGALLADKLTLTNLRSKDMYCVINTLINLGVNMDIKDDRITVYKVKSFDRLNLKTDVYPSFPSDLQQIMSVFLFYGNKVSLVEETLFENRFDFLNQIAKMNGKFFVFDNKAMIIPSILKGARIKCEDLRGAAALLLAAISCEDDSVLEDVYYIERGYENIVKDLTGVGVKIKEVIVHEA